MQHGDRVFRMVAIRVVPGIERLLEIAIILGLAVVNHADGHVGAAIEGVDGRGQPCCPRIVFGDGDGGQTDLATRGEAVEYGQRQAVIHIVADVGVEDDRDGRSRRREGEHAAEQRHDEEG